MPIRKLERIFDKSGMRYETIVECDQCGKQIAFETQHIFSDVATPPEVEELGFTKILKRHRYDFICKEHVK